MNDEQPPQWFLDVQRGDFHVGDEVIVRLNGECQRGVLHGDQEDGVRAIIIGLDSTNIAGHPIWVCYRQALPVKGHGGCYTATELERFDLMAEIAKMADYS